VEELSIHPGAGCDGSVLELGTMEVSWAGCDGCVLGWVRWKCPGLGVMKVSWGGLERGVPGWVRCTCPGAACDGSVLELHAMEVSWDWVRWRCSDAGWMGWVDGLVDGLVGGLGERNGLTGLVDELRGLGGTDGVK